MFFFASAGHRYRVRLWLYDALRSDDNVGHGGRRERVSRANTKLDDRCFHIQCTEIKTQLEYCILLDILPQNSVSITSDKML